MREYLKKIRVEKNMSQQSVADALGTSRQYYNLIENGERQRDLNVLTLEKLAKVFRVPPMELLKAEVQYRQENQ